MLVEGERVGSRKKSPVIAKIKIGHSQFRHAGGGGGADGLGLSPGGGGLARLLMAAPCDALAFRRVYRGPDDAGPDGVDSDAGSGVLDGRRTGASRLTASRTFRARARSPVARAVQRDAEALHVRDVDAGEQRPDVLREADCHQPAPFTARLARCQWLAIWPPSTCRISPVMYGDDSRNRTPFTTSLTCPARPSGGSRPRSAS